MKWNKRFHAFSTVEGIVASVILTIVVLLIYSTINHAIENLNTMTITRGVESYQTWVSQMNQEKINSSYSKLNFTGGYSEIEIENHSEIAGLYQIKVTIRNSREKKIISWTELKYFE